MHCQVVIQRANGTRTDPIPFEVTDGADDAAIQAAARRAVQEYSVGRGVSDVDVNFDVYIDTNPDSPGAQGAGDHMLFMRGGNLVREAARTTRPAGTSPLTYHVEWARDQILRAKVTNMATLDTDPAQEGVQTMPGLEGLSYVSDGQRGPLSQEEARTFLRRFEMLFPNDAAGRARLQHVYSQNPEFNFGPDGTFRLNDAYTRAGISPPGSTDRPETGGPNDPLAPEPGSPEAVAGQIVNNDIDMSGLSAKDRKLLDEIRRMVALLVMGADPDIILPYVMSLFRQLSANGQARAGVMVAQALERTQNQINTNAERIATLQGNSGAAGRTPQQAGSDAGEITRLTAANQVLTNSTSGLRSLLESFRAQMEEVQSMERAASEFRSRLAQRS